MKKKLVIIGTGLFPEVARCYFDELSDYVVVAFACHEKYKTSDTIYGLPLHSIEDLKNVFPPNEVDLFIAIGYKSMNRVRQDVYEELKQIDYNCATFVHPNVKIWKSTRLGDNVFIFEDNTIQPFTKIGNNTVMWSGNHLGHHSTVGNHCFISSHVVISGSCTIGNNVFIGVNATFHDGLTIGDQSLVGAGTLISKSTKPKEVYLNSHTKPFPKDSEKLGF